MEEFLKRTWIQIDLDALKENYNAIRERVTPAAQIIGIVKADAYGHGAVHVAQELYEIGCRFFAVSNLEEALQLRRAGVEGAILILGYTPPEMAQALAVNDITQAVFDCGYGERLAACARESGVIVNVHIKVDTGMTRIGFRYQDSEEDRASVDDIEAVCRLEGLFTQGIFTHFASADEGADGEIYTRLQFDLFLDIIARLAQRGITFELRHCCNSAATLCYPEMQLDGVRPGVILYGLYPSDAVRGTCLLRPVMELKTVVSMVKDVPAGSKISYGRTFTAERDMRVATVPVGYADGYPRALSGKAYMLINGQKAPVVGRICMDQTMLDVTEIPGVQEGMEVTAFGADHGERISVDDLARMCGMINYEIICGISKRVPQVYLKDGKFYDMVDYITK